MDESKKSAIKLGKKLIIAAVIVGIVVIIVVANNILLMTKYHKAMKLREEGNFDEAIVLFEELYDYKDSQKMIEVCRSEKVDATYFAAVDAMEDGDYREALAVFRQYPNFRDSDKLVDEILSSKDYIKSTTVGDTFYFGSYNGKPIEWRVVGTSGNTRHVIAQKLVDGHAYNDNGNYTIWENSDLRYWLNNDFYNAAFSAEEKAKIIPSDDSGVTDNLYIPSLDNVKNFFPSSDVRFTVHHTGAGGCSWWILAQGETGNTVKYVDSNGEINNEGGQPNYQFGARPVMWVNIE